MNGDHQPYGSIAFLGGAVSAYVSYSMLYAVTFWGLWNVGDWQQGALCAALIMPLIWLSVSDFQTFELPDFGTLMVAAISFMFVGLTNPTALMLHVATGTFVTASLWLVGGFYFRRTGQEGLGIGDAKLFGAGAVLLGPWQLPDLILLASMGGILGYGLSRLHCAQTERRIPFGPFIAYAMLKLRGAQYQKQQLDIGIVMFSAGYTHRF